MVKAGVKAVFSEDNKTVTTWCYPSHGHHEYKLTQKTWKNECPSCKKKGRTSRFKFNNKKTPEGELTCKSCDADFCGVSGQEKRSPPRWKLTPATANPNSATKVAGSKTKSQTCELTKAEAKTKAKKLLKTTKSYKSTLKIPIIKNIKLGDLCQVKLGGFPETKKKKLHIEEIKEDIDNQTYELTLEEGKAVWTKEYKGSYIFKDKKGHIIGGKGGNPLQAKCKTVNTSIGLKDNSDIGKKIKLKPYFKNN